MTATEFILNLTFWSIVRLTLVQVIVFFVIYRFVRSRQTSIFDPFSLALFFFSSGWGIVFELILMQQVSTRLVIVFITTNTAFLIGYLAFAPKLSTNHRIQTGCQNLTRFGLIATSVYLLATTLNIWLFGFGISHESRLAIYSDSGGFGILKRILDAYMPACIFFLTYIAGTQKSLKKAAAVTLLVTVTINTILDGSKSGLVAIFFAYTISQHWLRASNLIRAPENARRNFAGWLLGAFFIALLVLGFQLRIHEDMSRATDLFAVLFFRLAVAGDIFILGFPRDLIDQVPSPHNPFLVLFSDLLSTLRIWSGNIVPLGTELLYYSAPELGEISGGPNSHISIYVYRLFGEFGGMLAAFIFGSLYGLIRMLYAKSIGNDPVIAAMAITLVLNCANVPIDPSYTMHRLTNILILLTPLVLIFFRLKVRNRESSNLNSKLARRPINPKAC